MCEIMRVTCICLFALLDMFSSPKNSMDGLSQQIRIPYATVLFYCTNDTNQRKYVFDKYTCTFCVYFYSSREECFFFCYLMFIF